MNTLDALQRTRLTAFLDDSTGHVPDRFSSVLDDRHSPQLALAQQTTTKIDPTPTDLTPIGELDPGDI